MVVTSGNKDIRELAHERTDLAAMVEQFTKWTAEATYPEQVPFFLRRAFNEAKTPPTGPTFVGFSANSLDNEADVDIFPSPRAITGRRRMRKQWRRRRASCPRRRIP